jgi:hypothetical protein
MGVKNDFFQRGSFVNGDGSGHDFGKMFGWATLH